jgi:hypothetical protein
MSEDLAVVCAQVLPVLALALLAILEAFRRSVSKAISKVENKATFKEHAFTIFAGILWYGIWAWLMVRIVDSETLCIDRIQGMHVAMGSGNSVSDTVTTAITLMFVLPIIGTAASWIFPVWDRVYRKYRDKLSADNSDNVESGAEVSPDTSVAE